MILSVAATREEQQPIPQSQVWTGLVDAEKATEPIAERRAPSPTVTSIDDGADAAAPFGPVAGSRPRVAGTRFANAHPEHVIQHMGPHRLPILAEIDEFG